MGDTKLAQGEANVRSYFLANPDISDTVERKLREIYSIPIEADVAVQKESKGAAK
jgi:hypothetical protein